MRPNDSAAEAIPQEDRVIYCYLNTSAHVDNQWIGLCPTCGVLHQIGDLRTSAVPGIVHHVVHRTGLIGAAAVMPCNPYSAAEIFACRSRPEMLRRSLAAGEVEEPSALSRAVAKASRKELGRSILVSCLVA